MRVAIPLSIVLALMFAASVAAQSVPAYDGSFWQSLSAAEQDGFISGYLDCYVWKAGQTELSGCPIKQLIDRVSAFYRTNPGELDTAVPEVLGTFPGKGERKGTGERHGSYDGDFWRQTSRSGRIAFVRGYVACASPLLSTRFPGTPERYAESISKWYGVSDTDESQLNDKTANDKIGDVLERFRDDAPQSR